jgi:hypothetical protein
MSVTAGVSPLERTHLRQLLHNQPQGRQTLGSRNRRQLPRRSKEGFCSEMAVVNEIVVANQHRQQLITEKEGQ